MSMRSCRRLEEDQEEKSLSELEVAFLESIEHSRVSSFKSTTNQHHCRESTTGRALVSFVQWRSRWRARLEELKDQLAHKLVCCAHELNTFTDEDDENEYDQLLVLDKRSDAMLERKDTAAKSSASIAPFSVAIQRPDDMQDPIESVPKEPLEDTSHAPNNAASVSYELDAVIKIQHVFRAYSALTKYQQWKKECKRKASKARANASFARVCVVLNCLVVMKKLGEKRRSRIAASVIQHKWRCVKQVSKTVASFVSDALTQSVIVPSHFSSLVNRKRSRATIDEVPEVSEPDDIFAPEESDLLVPGFLEPVGFVTHYVSVALPATVVQPIAVKSRGVLQRKAACVIQSAWRCAVAREHANALRRLSAYEQEYESVMPTVRSQMNIVRQRLSELQSRSSSDSEVEFDDDWL